MDCRLETKLGSNMAFCRTCGSEIRSGIFICGTCEALGKTLTYENAPVEDLSPKSYGITIVLIWVFGLMGIHHFYLKNWFHGFFDFGLFIFGFGFVFFSHDLTLHFFGLGLISIDVAHSLIVTYLVIVGKCKDGDGLYLPYPGQS
jgi:TM2 domain-containing membrane protein YozV